jgi:hypothetical protein
MKLSASARTYAAGSTAWHTIMGGVRRWQQIPDVTLQREQVGAQLLLHLDPDHESLQLDYIDALEKAAQDALDLAIKSMRAWAEENGRRDLTLKASAQLEEML